MTTNLTPDTIVLIHGLWMTPRSWEKWIERYEARGYRVIAPSWPGLEGEVEALRADPSPLADLSAEKILAHYERIIRELDSPPIIMGHSFGGAFAQLLVGRGLGAAGVIDGRRHRPRHPGPADLDPEVVSAHVLSNPLNRGKAVPFSYKHFKYAFGNTLDDDAAMAAYDRYAVPAAARVLFEGAMANLSPKTAFTVRLGEQRARTAALHRRRAGPRHPGQGEPQDRPRRPARTTRSTRARSHFTAGEPGWEEVADYALTWATEHAEQQVSVTA